MGVSALRCEIEGHKCHWGGFPELCDLHCQGCALRLRRPCNDPSGCAPVLHWNSPSHWETQWKSSSTGCVRIRAPKRIGRQLVLETRLPDESSRQSRARQKLSCFWDQKSGYAPRCKAAKST